MTIRIFVKRMLMPFSVAVLTGLAIEFVRHRSISREYLIGFLPVALGFAIVGAFPPREHKTAGRLGFRLGQKLREYRRGNAES